MESERAGRLSSVYGRSWRKLLSKMTAIIQKKTKHSLPLLSREQEVGLESVAEGAVDFEMVLIFNCFSLTFCIILHKKITCKSSSPSP